jgi:hypothetical protein
MSDFAHKLAAGLGVAASGAIPAIALHYQGNWLVAMICTATMAFLSAFGYVAVKPLVKGGGQ